MKPLLIWISALDLIANARVDVRVGSVPSPMYAGLGGLNWEGAVSRRPRIMQDLMSPDISGKVETAKGDLALNLNHVMGVASPQSLNYVGAPITIYDASSFDYANLGTEFTGIVKDATLDIWTRQLVLNLEVEKSKMERPLLSLSFDGSGGLGGDANLRGTLKPAGFGYVQNAEPVWFDTTNNIGMLDGYGNLTSVQGLFEGGSDRGASFGDYASYALLAVAAIPRGRWATCLAQGLVRLGAPPVGRISCDATYRGAAGTGANLPGALIRRIFEAQAGIATADLDTAAFAALDIAVPRTVHYWTKEQRDCLDLAEAIAASCNASVLIQLNGKIAVTRAFGGTNIGTINRTGTSVPPVTDWQIAGAEDPLWRMRARACRPGSVFTYDEIAYEDDLIDRGAYSAAETYRQGHLVWMPDGSQWLYINATPGSGNSPAAVISPATSNAYWQRTKAPTTAADLSYADGTLIESLKPAAVGATRNIIYPPSGVDPAGSNTIYNGDIWTDTSGTVPKIKTRVAGAWVISANYVTQGTDIGVANGATANVITYSSVTPASPNNGDIWVDTSVTPNVARVRVGGAWQASSNLVTQGTDIGVANNAGTTLSLSIIGAAGTKNGPGNAASFTGSLSGGFDQGVVSDASIKGGAYCEARFLTNFYSAFGFSTAKAAPWVNGGGWVLTAGGTVLAFDEAGTTWTPSGTTAFSATAVFGFLYDGVNNYWFRDSALVLQRPATTAGQLYVFNARFNASGGSIDKIQFTPAADNAWLTMGGAGKPSDNATSDLKLTSIGANGLTIVGNTVTSLSATANYESQVRGELRTGAQFAEMDIPAANHAIICMDDLATGTDYTVQSCYASYHPPTGTVAMYANGVQQGSTLTIATSLTGKATLIYDGTAFRFSVAGIERLSFAAAVNLALYPKWIIYNATISISGLRAGPANDAAASNVKYTSGSTVDAKEPAEPLADVTRAVSWSEAGGTVIINADSTGAILAGQLPLTLALPTFTIGGVPKRTDNLTTYAIANSTFTAGYVTVDTITGSSTKGQVTLTASVAASGGFNLVVTYNSQQIASWHVDVVVKNQAATTGGGGGGSTTSGSFGVSGGFSGTDTVAGSVTGLVVSGGKSIRCNFADTYSCFGISKTVTAASRFQYSVQGSGVWNNVGTDVAGGTASTDSESNPSPASITVNQTVTPASGTYDVRQLISKTGGTATSARFDDAIATVTIS